jgi:hypothetical protein
MKQRKTYTIMDELMASPSEPLAIHKRMYQLELMWKSLENIEKGENPTRLDWQMVSDAVNMVEALRDLGVVQDPEGAIDDAVKALGKAGMRSLDGHHIRLDGRDIILMRGLLEDYCEAINELPARTMIRAHRYAEERIQGILRGKKRSNDVVIKNDRKRG